MANELTVYKKTDIVALDESNPQVEALLYNISQAGGLNDSDLPRIKNPSGGALVFEFQRAGQQPEYLKELVGVMLFQAPRRTLWSDKSIGSGEQPVCSSEDLIHGSLREDENGNTNIPDSILKIAMPGGDDGKCANCHFNKWGTATDSSGKPTRGKACSETKVLYFLRTGDALPCKLTIPSGSLKAFNQALKQLPVRADRAVIKLTLTKEKSGGGVEFAQYQVQLVAGLDADAVEQLKKYGELLKTVFERVQADRETRQSGDTLKPAPAQDDAF